MIFLSSFCLGLLVHLSASSSILFFFSLSYSGTLCRQLNMPNQSACSTNHSKSFLTNIEQQRAAKQDAEEEERAKLAAERAKEGQDFVSGAQAKTLYAQVRS